MSDPNSTVELLPYPGPQIVSPRAPRRPGQRSRDPLKPYLVGALMVAVVLAVLTFAGCAQPGYVKADQIEGTVARIISRHDAYVKADKAYTNERKRATDLRDGAVVLNALNAAKEADSE